MTVSSTILSQLGGNQFLAMTGARNLLSSGHSLQFDVAGKGCNKVRISLAAGDTYTVEAFKFSRKTLSCPVVAHVEGVQVAELRATFSRLTSLHTSL